MTGRTIGAEEGMISGGRAINSYLVVVVATRMELKKGNRRIIKAKAEKKKRKFSCKCRTQKKVNWKKQQKNDQRSRKKTEA